MQGGLCVDCIAKAGVNQAVKSTAPRGHRGRRRRLQKRWRWCQQAVKSNRRVHTTVRFGDNISMSRKNLEKEENWRRPKSFFYPRRES